jgi:hypothetical protein
MRRWVRDFVYGAWMPLLTSMSRIDDVVEFGLPSQPFITDLIVNQSSTESEPLK